MATAKPKRMMFGGIAKGAMNAVKNAVQAKPSMVRPIRDIGTGSMPRPGGPKPGGMGPRPGGSITTPRGATAATPRPGMPPKPIRDPGTGSMPRPGGMGPRGPRPPMPIKPTGIGQAMGPRGPRAALGAAGAMAGRALGMGKKKGGAVKKATKK